MNKRYLTSLETSKKLKDAGFPQVVEEEAKYWLQYHPRDGGPEKWRLINLVEIENGIIDPHPSRLVYAPDAGEILDLLGSFYLYKSKDGFYHLEKVRENMEIVFEKLDEYLAEAAAKMWLYLKKEGLL